MEASLAARHQVLLHVPEGMLQSHYMCSVIARPTRTCDCSVELSEYLLLLQLLTCSVHTVYSCFSQLDACSTHACFLIVTSSIRLLCCSLTAVHALNTCSRHHQTFSLQLTCSSHGLTQFLYTTFLLGVLTPNSNVQMECCAWFPSTVQ